ncbi:hypothetical protein AB1H94_17520 [Pseudomonas fulva]|uniref:hypothetical protein n=1 Tax=Pseudomonas fulva TaxID=47880 RepID=UPI00345D463C
MAQGFWGSVGRFESSLSFAEWLWRIFSFVSVGGGAVIAGSLAKVDPVLKEMGWLYWFFIALLAGLIIALILYLIKLGVLRQSEANYYDRLKTPKSLINPLQETFTDVIIPVEDLRLPTYQMQSKKHFRRCTFVGPGSLVISGGSYVDASFRDIGDMIALSHGCSLVGIVVLEDCTVDSCEFIRVTIITDQIAGKAFSEMGASVKGLIS